MAGVPAGLCGFCHYMCLVGGKATPPFVPLYGFMEGDGLPLLRVRDLCIHPDDRAVQVEPNTGEPTTYWKSRA